MGKSPAELIIGDGFKGCHLGGANIGERQEAVSRKEPRQQQMQKP
jgi:hypothetical protein